MEYLKTLWHYIEISAPFLLLGCTIAGLLHSFISMDAVKNILGKNARFTSFKAAFIGVPLPLCSCSVIPTAVTLKKAGASNGATSAFLIATPESGVDSIAMTYGLMDIPMAIIRPLAAFFSAIFAGVLQNNFNDYELVEKEPQVKSCCKANQKSTNSFWKKILFGLKYGYTDIIEDIAVWLTLGLVVGATIDYFLPPLFFTTLSPSLSRLAILAIGVPLYICASASTPIAAGLMMKGMSPGTALLLLLVGPATNISNILVMKQYLGTKGIIINLFSIIAVALGFSYLTDYLYSAQGWVMNFGIGSHQHDEGGGTGVVLMGIVFLLLLFRGLWKKKIQSFIASKKSCCAK